MHPGQITALTAALAATMITLVAYMSMMSSDPSKTFIKSTWHLTVNDDESESGDGTPQTWYINTADNVIKIVEHDEESESINVQEIHAGGVYEYSMADPNMDLTVSAEACEDADLTNYDGDCESYRADIQSSIEDLSKLEIKAECSETLLTDETISFAKTLPCDGNAIVGGFLVSFAECTPTAILNKESGNVVATIDSIEDGIDESITFTKCQDDDEDAARRKLGWSQFTKNLSHQIPCIMNRGGAGLMALAECAGTSSNWCGGGTDFDPRVTKCPEMGDQEGKDDQACRRHDHGIVGTSVAGHMVKLECQVDFDLVEKSDGWAVRGVFGHNGAARFTGCLNYSNVRRARWLFRPLEGGFIRQRRGWQWVTRYGTKRMRKARGMNDRAEMGHLIPGSHIPHVRGKKEAEFKTEVVSRDHGNGKPWYYHWIPKDKVYKDRIITCPQDNLAGRSIENDICWHCNSPYDWGP